MDLYFRRPLAASLTAYLPNHCCFAAGAAGRHASRTPQKFAPRASAMRQAAAFGLTGGLSQDAATGCLALRGFAPAFSAWWAIGVRIAAADMSLPDRPLGAR